MDFTGGKSLAEIDKEAIEKFNRQLELNEERERKLLRHYEWRGNKLPPFNIQPLPYERDRLAGAGMTAEDRALRRQWLKDQELAPNEPLYIPELYPRNPIRQLLGAPWNAIARVIEPVVGERCTIYARYWVPKLVVSTIFAYATYYHFKYNPSTWTTTHGWHVFSSKPTCLPGGAMAPVKAYDDYNDRGFKKRTVLLDPKTSTAPN